MKKKFFITIGRVFAVLSFITFLLMWVASNTGTTVMGMGEAHLANDAIIFALLSIVCLLDGVLHSKNL